MNKTGALVTVAFAMVFCCFSTARPQTEGEGSDVLEQARKLDAAAVSAEDKQQAIEKYREALTIFQNASDYRGIFAAANNIGILLVQLGDFKTALTYFEKASHSLDDLTPPPLEEKLKILDNMAVLYRNMGAYTRSLKDLERALEIANDLKNPALLRQVHYSMGQTYFDMGRYGAALESFLKALNLAMGSNDKHGTASAYFGIAQVYSVWSEYHESEKYYAKALSQCAALGRDAKTCEGSVYNGIGLLSEGVGRYDIAFDYFRKSLTAIRETGAPAAAALVNLGRVHQFQENYEKALSYYSEALKEYEEAGNRPDATHVQKLISYLYLDMCEAGSRCRMDKAQEYAEASGVWVALGRVELARKNYVAAAEYYEKALTHAEKRDDSDGLFLCCTALGSIHEGLQALDKAEWYYSRAVEHLEEIRAALTPSEKVNFFDVKVGGFLRIAPYKGLARVHMSAGRLRKAFVASEYTKARSFAESLTSKLKTGTLGIPHDVLASDLDLHERLSALLKQKRAALISENTEAVAQIAVQIDTTRRLLSDHVMTLRKRFPAYAAVRYPLPISLEEASVEKGEWAVSYDVSETGIIVYLTRGRELIQCSFKPISQRDLETLVRRFREPLQLGPGDNLTQKLVSFDFGSSKKLADILVHDLLKFLPEGTPVLIIPDGALGMVPFEMLTLSDTGSVSHDAIVPKISGGDFFGDRNPVHYCQSMTALSLARVQKRPKKYEDSLLVMADPVFDSTDDRVEDSMKTAPSEAGLSLMAGKSLSSNIVFPRLEVTGELAKTLAALYSDKSTVYTGLAASKNNLLENIAPTLTKYGKIVFATHGFFGKDIPGLPEPVLIFSLLPPGTDGLLSMNEIMALHMDADVVALTACNTGIGKHVSGEGTMGVGRAFQCAGARSVLMTLWSVAESPSVDLTTAFFQNLREGKGKLNALQSARAHVRRAGFDHPFFWAGFILVGEVD